MSDLTSRLVRLLACLAFLAASSTPATPAPQNQEQRPEERMLEAGFDVAPGQRLKVDVPDAHVLLVPGEDDRLEVEVYLVADDLERARQRYEAMGFLARLRGTEVSVTAEDPGTRWSWRDHGPFDVRVEIRHPERFDVDIRTGDGAILLERIVGEIRAASGDGDIGGGRLEGPTRITTADGDIEVDSVIGDEVVLETSDGDVRVGTVSASSLVMRSSDGDLIADVADADRVRVSTSDGTIRLGGVRGPLEADTHDGDIEIDLDIVREIDLDTGEGDVRISLPEDAAATLDLRGSDVELEAGGSFDGRIHEGGRFLEGTLNGGGPTIRVHSGDGTVSVRLRKSR